MRPNIVISRIGSRGKLAQRVILALAMIFCAGAARATLLWDGNATNGPGVFKILDLEDENKVEQSNPSTNGSYIVATNDAIYGKVWLFYKAVNDLRAEAHGANGINPAIGSTYYIGWKSRLVLPTTAQLNAIFQWKAYGTPQLQDFPITIAPGGGNLNLNEYNPSDAGGQTFLFSTPLITNVWNQHVLAIYVSDQDYGGSIQYWYNGVQQTFFTGSNIFYCRTFDGTSVDPKWGIYGDDIDACSDYVTALKIGTTYADVVDTLYALTASPPSQYTGLTGTNISYTVNVVTNAGFTGSITLAVSGLPANTSYTLNPSVFTGQGTATLTVTTSNNTPQGSYTVLVSGINGTQTNYYTVLMQVTRPPATYVWNGPGTGNNDWSAAANWSPTGPPSSIDTVDFFDAGAVSGVSNINNFVDTGFGGTIASLQYGNTNNDHTTSIAPGQTLNVGGLTVGTETDNGSAQTVSATITGPGATLAVNTTSDFVVRQGSASSGSHTATLQMSGLGKFNATLGRVLVGVAGPVVRSTGTLYLARTNTILAEGAYPQICVGDNHANGGGGNFLYLGQTNSFYIDSITIGRQKATGTLAFNPGFANPTAFFYNVDGESPITSWSIADNSAQSTSSSGSTGTCDFSLGTVNALVDAMNVGVGQTSTGAGGSGTLNFVSGTINVNSLNVGVQSANGATSAGVGHMNVNGTNAVLVVNSTLTLGATVGGTGTANSFGTLNVNGGTVLANSILTGAGSGANFIGVNKGTLVVSNTVGATGQAVTTVALTNSTLQFSAAGSQVNLTATSLNTGGASNVIDIASLPAIGSVPDQFPLIEYTSIGGSGYNFVLGSLPSGENFAGYLSNNVANSSVDLVAVQFPANGPSFASAKLAGTNLVFSGINGVASWPYFVLTTTNLALPASKWSCIATDAFDSSGNFVFTNNPNASSPIRFFCLQPL